jgi:spore maturation protein CgeB
LRALLVRPGPQFSVQDVHNGWVKALRGHGVEVAEYELDARLNFYAHAQIEFDGELRNAFDFEAAVRMAANGLKQAVYDYWPHAIIVTSAFFVPPDFYPLFRSRGHKLVALFTESPYEDDKQIARAHHFDVCLVNDPTNIELFRGENPQTHYVPHAYDPDSHRPGPGLPEFACDVSFVGTGYPSRAGFLRAVDFAGLDVKLGGNWKSVAGDRWFEDRLVHPIGFCLDNTETVELYQSSRASLNLYRKEASEGVSADGWAMGPREVELAATRTFFLREPRGEGDDVFPMLPTFSEAAEIRPLLDWWFAHDHARAAAVTAAHKAIEGRTFSAHAADLLKLL